MADNPKQNEGGPEEKNGTSDCQPSAAKRPRVEDDSKAETESSSEEKMQLESEKESGGNTKTTSGPTSEGKLEKDVVNVYKPHHEYAVKEADVGITKYISTHAGFHGVIKERYSDFQVNEIGLDGEVVHLTSTDLPPAEIQASVSDSVVSAETLGELESLAKSKDATTVVTVKVREDVEERKLIHLFINTKFPSLDSTTGDKDGSKVIEVKVKAVKGQQQRSQWPQGRGDYCHFVLYKENKDTMDALNLLASFLRMKPGMTFAGTKDRRAKTCQNVAVYRVEAERLLKLNKKLRNIYLGNFRYCDAPLELGMLKGNRFGIVLRNVTADTDLINEAMASLKDSGFINYFGMQRFGTTAVPTHHVGRLMLLSKWSEAVDLILKPRDGANPRLFGARKIWTEERDAQKAKDALGKAHGIENHLLVGLIKHDKNDYVGALGKIPRNSRHMYIHSYQSYIWNCMVSKRIGKHNFDVVLGDLAIKSTENVKKTEPTVVTEANKSEFTIQDIVMPLPGYDVVYPSNEMSDWYREILDIDGMDTCESFRHKIKDYALAGTYRHMILQPHDVSWHERRYEDVKEALILSDFEIMKGEKLTEKDEGPMRALCISFSLPPSCYATMALRELLKTDTSASHQASLNSTTAT